MRRALSISFILALLALPVLAQASPGDWLLASNGYPTSGLFRMHPLTGSLSPFTSLPGYAPSTLYMAPNNVDVVAVDSLGYTVDTLHPNGSLAASFMIQSLTGLPGQLTLDQDGTYVEATEWSGLLRFDVASQLEGYVFQQVHFTEFGVCVDGDTGDYIISGVFYGLDGRLIRVNRVTHAASIIINGSILLQPGTVDFDPLTGDFLVATGDAFSPLLRVHRNGTAASMGMFVPSGAMAARVDQETGNILVAGTSSVALLGPTGNQIRSFAIPTGMAVGGLEVFGARKITGSGPATANSTYTIRISFPGLGGRSYLGALSNAMRPGIALSDGTGRVISLAPDGLFSASLGGVPGHTTGFSGVLDSSGHATATVHIPPGLPAGTRVFFSAVAFDPAQPSGFATANTIGFSIN